LKETGAKIYGTQQIGSYISLSEFAGLEMYVTEITAKPIL
jgi:hypothetical protein